MRGEGLDLFTKESPLPLSPEGALLQPVISTKIDKSISSRFMPALYHRGLGRQGGAGGRINYNLKGITF